jgi:hypothetical protein
MAPSTRPGALAAFLLLTGSSVVAFTAPRHPLAQQRPQQRHVLPNRALSDKHVVDRRGGVCMMAKKKKGPAGSISLEALEVRCS